MARRTRPTPESLAKIAARSMCPTCEGREPEPGEEAYASCFFCAFADLSALSRAGDAVAPRSALSASAAHPHLMTIARVPAGSGDGGRFAPVERPESDLSLVESPAPVMPDIDDIERRYPNRYQACDVVNEALYETASHSGNAETQIAAAETAVLHTFDVHGRFVTLPEDDGESASYVMDALKDPAKIGDAIDQVGVLANYEARSFGNRVAGALYDIETAEREARLLERAIADSPVADTSDEALGALYASEPDPDDAA